MKGKMTTSRMGIMGSFLDSNFSLDVVTESPWDYSQPTNLREPLILPRSWHPATWHLATMFCRVCLTDYSCGVLTLALLVLSAET
jgi:hypothetical protein